MRLDFLTLHYISWLLTYLLLNLAMFVHMFRRNVTRTFATTTDWNAATTWRSTETVRQWHRASTATNFFRMAFVTGRATVSSVYTTAETANRLRRPSVTPSTTRTVATTTTTGTAIAAATRPSVVGTVQTVMVRMMSLDRPMTVMTDIEKLPMERLSSSFSFRQKNSARLLR